VHARLRGCVTVLDARALHGLDFARPPPPVHDYFLDDLVAQEDAKQQQRVITAERLRELSSSPHLPARDMSSSPHLPARETSSSPHLPAREMSSSPHLPEVRAAAPLDARKVCHTCA